MIDIKNFTSAIAQIAEERGIPAEKVWETIESAIAAAYKKEYGKKGQVIKAKLDQKTGEVLFWQVKKVVNEEMIYTEAELSELKDKKVEEETVGSKVRFNPERHIMLDEAKKINSKIKIDEEVEIPLEVKEDFGRISAQTAKQVILQKIREAERETVLTEYKAKEGEIVSGIVQRIEGGNVLFDIGKTLGFLPREEQIPGEFYRPGQRLKLFLIKVEDTSKGPIIILSRAYPRLVSKLFELEVPEINQGQVQINSIAREAGSRTKIAISTKAEGIDPIGAAVGQRGTRVQAVINELGGEKIDIIEYSEDPEKYLANALSPAKVIEIKIMPKNKALAVVRDDQLSLAIGKEGQNVRLAAKLTGWKIDVRSPEQVEEVKVEAKKEIEEVKKIAKVKKVKAKKETTEKIKLMLFVPIVVSLLSLIFAYFLIRQVNSSPSGSGPMIEISLAVRQGAVAFLKRQYFTAGLVSLVIFIVLWIFLGLQAGLGFLVGALASGVAGFIGMMVSTKANLKVAEAAKSGLKPAFDLSFKGGAVTGFLVVGLGLLSVSVFYLITQDLRALVALGLGGSLISVFARLGGGIYTKAADVGADLVGKVEKGIPEDDPRNPAVIADLVGDNVGDCAGMAADLFETYVVSLVSGMVLAGLLFPNLIQAVFLPLMLGSLAILASIIASFFVRLPKEATSLKIMPTLYRGLIVTGILSAIGFYPLISKVAPLLNISIFKLYLPVLIGLAISSAIFLITEYFTSKKYRPVISIAESSQAGHGPNLITGLAVGMKSTLLPVLLICLGILISFALAGMYGLSLALVSMISLTGLIIALDSYGPITDNAAGIVEMSGQPEEVRKNTDALDSVGNTTKAVTKGYAIASAGLAALVLFAAFTQELIDFGRKVQFTLEDPKVLVGLFLGGMVAYFFSALAIEAVGKAAMKVVDEVRRQFKEIPGLMEGQNKPDYSKCVDIVTKASLKAMILPALLPIVSPILVGFILGPEALGGLLIGSIVVGIFLAISMTSGGGAWDNAKKYIEEGNFGGKGSFAHQAAVTGDTVGDPYKDTAGPAINPMIKILNIVALLIVGFLV